MQLPESLEHLVLNALQLIIAAACVVGVAQFGLSLIGIRSNLVGSLLRTAMAVAGEVIQGGAVLSWRFLRFLALGMTAQSNGLMTRREMRREFSPQKNTGIVLSDRYRLSEESSMHHCLVLGGSGQGKSSGYIAPNLVTLRDCSLVINDPKGALIQRYAPVLAKHGFQVSCLNMVDPATSFHFNPLLACRDQEDIDSLCAALLRSQKDPYWQNSALSMLKYTAAALLNHPDDEYKTVANLALLIDTLQHGRMDRQAGARFGGFLMQHLVKQQPRLYQKFKAQFSSSEKYVQGWASTATSALEELATPELEKIASTNDLPLDRLRAEPHAIFLTIPPRKSRRYYAFMGLFYGHLFDRLLTRLPQPDELPIYMLLDEFPAMFIQDFPDIIAQAREYRIGLSLICQSLSQLDAQYGHDVAKVIIENCATRIILPGLEHAVAKQYAEALGRIDVKDPKTGITGTREIATPQDIRMLQGQALVFSANKKPAFVPYVKIHENKRLSRISGLNGFAIDWPPARDTPLLDLSSYTLPQAGNGKS